MADYFNGQTNLKIELETNVDLTSATLLIKYEKPNGATGSFAGTIDGSDNSIMYYNIASAANLDISGDWKFWAHVTFADSTIGIGKVVVQKIKTEGQI